PVQVYLVTGGEFFWICHKTVRIHRVENKLPFEMLLTWQNERDRFVMCVDQKQKRFVPNRFALKTQDVGRIAAQQHSHTTNEWRRPFFVAHLVSARVEPHDIAGFRSAYPPALEKLRTS